MRSAVPALPLRSGDAIPILGFGTWQLRGTGARDAVRVAVDVGYRHIDTATMYENEKQVGEAVRASGVSREDVFITTKLPPSRATRARQTLERSLRLLGIDYVDLWLIHWPIEDGASPTTWRALLDARDAGLAKAPQCRRGRLQPVQTQQLEGFRAPRDCRRARKKHGAGDRAVAHSTRHRGDSEISERRSNLGELRRVGFRLERR